jgi:hypothetical protein
MISETKRLHYATVVSSSSHLLLLKVVSKVLAKMKVSRRSHAVKAAQTALLASHLS